MAWLQDLSGWLGGTTGYEQEQEIERRRPVRQQYFVFFPLQRHMRGPRLC
jgi:hypothetical protein